MKSTKLLTLLAVFASPMSFALTTDCQDYVIGSCEFELSGNDVTSYWGASDDRLIKDLKKSVVSENFKICALATKQMKHEYMRVIPFNNKLDKVADYQIAAFSLDSTVKQVAEENQVPMEAHRLGSTSLLAIEYTSRGASIGSKLSDHMKIIDSEATTWPQLKINFRNEDHEFKHADIKVRVKLPNGKGFRLAEKTKIPALPLFEGGNIEFTISDKITFEYKDIPGDGLTGLVASDTISQKEYDDAETKIQKNDLKIKCSVKLPTKEEEAAVIDEPRSEVDDETPASNPYANMTTFGPGSGVVEN